MMHCPKCIVVLLSCVCVAAASGCGGSKIRRVSVEGVVTYKGEPAAGVMVGFVDDAGVVSMGKTDASGKFKISEVPVGNRKVTVRSLSPATEDSAAVSDSSKVLSVQKYRAERTQQRNSQKADEKEKTAAGSSIPLKYNGINSGLTAEVKNAGENFFQFNLE